MDQQSNFGNTTQQVNQSQQIKNPFVDYEQNDIQICVGEPITKESTLSKFTVYNIKGFDANGAFDVYRRFSEFYCLKETLVSRWPGCFIPSIPAKEINSTSQNVVENRARFLNSFCNQVAKLKHLFYSDEFQLFLRSKESDVSKTLQGMKKVNVVDIIDKYQNIFPSYINKRPSQELNAKISGFYMFLSKAVSDLSNQKEQLKLLATLRKELNDNFEQLNTNLLPEYEKLLISEYVAYDNNALIFQNQFNANIFKAQEEIKNSKNKNSFQHFYDMVKFELRDAEAFIELVNQKDEYEKKRFSLQKDFKSDEEDFQKLVQGKKTIKAIFSSVDEQKKKLEQQLDQQQNELKNYDVLIDIITNIIGEIEIERFKNEKRTIYQRVLRCVAESEIQNSNDMVNYWNTVNDVSRKLQN